MFHPSSTPSVARNILGLISCLWASATLLASGPPNIILINCDNLGIGDLGCYGHPVHQTPEIDKLAAEGIRLTDFYAASPVCTSSRAALLTGAYPRRNSMHEFDWDGSVLRPISPNGLHSGEVTLAELLKQQGYYTACLGKWHLGDQRPFLPPSHGFDYFLGLLYSDEMDDNIPLYNWPAMPLMENERVIEAPADLTTMTRRYTRAAQRIILEHRDEPFFLYIPQMSPGSRKEQIAGDEFVGTSANGAYGDTVEELDWSTGEILRTLEEAGLTDNTLVLWTSDNGAPPPRGTSNYGSNAPLAQRERWDASEGGFRVPLIARWPDQIPAGLTSSEITTQMDLFTTIALAAGATLPTNRTVDGKDILPLLRGDTGVTSPHEAFFYYFGGQLQAVRSDRWKLALGLAEPVTQLGMGQLQVSVIGFGNRRIGDPTQDRLYDLDADPTESNDLSAIHPNIVADLLVLADEARADLGDIGMTGADVRPQAVHSAPRPRLWDGAPLPVTPGGKDADGDGFPDLIWRNQADGRSVFHFLQDTQKVGTKATDFLIRSASYRVQGLGDFDGDGKADILWRRLQDGVLVINFMDGHERLDVKSVDFVLGTGWEPAAIADFDGDGKADIFSRHTATGETALHLMDGRTLRTTSSTNFHIRSFIWDPVGAGDFNNDGKADTVWHNATHGKLAVHTMDGPQRTAVDVTRFSLNPATWQIAGAADANRDGYADLVLRDKTDGQTAIAHLVEHFLLSVTATDYRFGQLIWELKNQ